MSPRGGCLLFLEPNNSGRPEDSAPGGGAAIWCHTAVLVHVSSKDVFITKEAGRTIEVTEKVRNGASRDALMPCWSMGVIGLACSVVIKSSLVATALAVPGLRTLRAIGGRRHPFDAPAKGQTLPRLV